jgi:hypothetical protein
MASVVLRARLVSGSQLDLSYEEPEVADAEQVVEHVIARLAQDNGVLRARHGDRLVVVYGRGVASIEVTPRGAVL